MSFKYECIKCEQIARYWYPGELWAEGVGGELRAAGVAICCWVMRTDGVGIHSWVVRNEAVRIRSRARGVAKRGELRAGRIGIGSRPLGTLCKTARRGILPQLTPKLQAGRSSCLNKQRS